MHKYLTEDESRFCSRLGGRTRNIHAKTMDVNDLCLLLGAISVSRDLSKQQLIMAQNFVNNGVNGYYPNPIKTTVLLADEIEEKLTKILIKALNYYNRSYVVLRNNKTTFPDVNF